MQLRRLWDDRTDLLRASLPPTPHGHPRPPNHLDRWRAKNTWTGHLNDAGFPSLSCQSVWVIRALNVSIFSLLRSAEYFRLCASSSVCVAGARGSSVRTDGCAGDTKNWQLFAHLFTGLWCSHLFWSDARRFSACYLCGYWCKLVRNGWICLCLCLVRVIMMKIVTGGKITFDYIVITVKIGFFFLFFFYY